MSQTQLSPELVSSYELEGYEDRAMSQVEIAQMLDNHGIKSKEERGYLFAMDRVLDTEIDLYVTRWVNTNRWTLFNVLSFLNY